ncbi:peroxisomal acyl-coenzyme A oxidase 2 isoform X2 [Lynx canadensis]|uniref:peroxisomal acyl-coenzyme A oxidase 2 isoform X2 n=1 Tax=Lynx canadensis TaxID=61383 RepID=UPI0011B06869|nr:peroxisomal acyl-coenzyme A oxidase 2 isoform X2 [Lynx canadensis]
MGSPVHQVSLGDTWSRQVNPDIERERNIQSFNVERLTNILDGRAENTALRRKVESIIHSDPKCSLKDNYFMTQNECYEAAIQRKFHIQTIAKCLGWSENSPEFFYAYRAVSGEVALTTHSVFLQALRSLGSEEQIAKWAPLCNNFQIITTYAQTELGHGTYLQGLETEATYDAATQEFVVHSPTMTATKWWPGDLGRSATHALVQAQLICSGARQGMHAFIVPIRSLEDHTPLPGITVGDIGPKMGFDCTDHGFLRLDHVRIPRDNMLSRFAQVLPDGTYLELGKLQINYLSMVITRVNLLWGEVTPILQKACVIAIRYSVIRRQSCLRPSDPEAKVLDHQTQQQKLFPQLATAYAFHFLTSNLLEFFHSSYDAILNKDFSLLSEMARFLEKNYLQAQASQDSTSQRSLPQSVAYLTAADLAKCPAQKAADFLHPQLYTKAWAHVAARLIKDSAHHLQTLMQSGADRYEAWNQTTVMHVQAAKAHCHYVSVKNFTETLDKLENEPAIQQVLKRLCDLYALHGILTNSGDFLHDGFLSGAQVDAVRTAYLDLLPLIRKDAILLTDAFDFMDQSLNSALGCYDGNVYERLFEWAQRSPTNTQGNPAYEKYLRPLLQSSRAKL